MELLTIAGLLAIILILVYFYGTRTHGYWKKRGVVYEKPLPIVGNLLDLVLLRCNQGQIVENVYKKHKDASVVGMWNFDAPVLLVRDPTLIYQVLVTDFHSFPNNELDVDPAVDPIMSNNLFCQRGERWKRNRQVLSPAFTAGRCKASFPKILATADKLAEYIINNPGEHQVKNMMALYTSEVVAGWGLGIDGHSFTSPDPILPKLGRIIFDPSATRAVITILNFLFPFVTRLARVRFIPKEVPDFFEGVIKEMLKHRQKTGESKPDYLQHFIDAQNKLSSRQDDHVITNDDILHGMVTFFVEGYETSSMVSSFLLYHLAMNPDIQEKLRAEVNAAPELSFEAISEMTYLHQCFLETNRMHVPIGNMSKSCGHKCQLGDVVIDPGTTIIIPFLGINSDPAYWPKPHKFNPDRFSEEERTKIPKGVFFPFGDGPRICIGLRLATILVKTGIARLLKEFAILPSARTPPRFEQNPYHFMSCQNNGLYLQFKKLPL